jgi:LuxR family transcriptional regulator of csgAB operon
MADLPLGKHPIVIFGSKRVQNEILSTLLEREVSAQCTFVSDGNIPIKTDGNAKMLVLLDCSHREVEKVLAGIAQKDIHIALFNVYPGSGVEERAVSMGVRGIFYERDSCEQFLKGIRAIQRGELWLSRDILARCIGTRRFRESGSRNHTHPLLTQRELEILSIVVCGATNEEIADKLFISPHTVKTHIYNIFKKINVPNRLQAAIWVSRNLGAG